MEASASPVASLSNSSHANMASVYTLFSGTDAHWAYKNVNLAMFCFFYVIVTLVRTRIS